MQRIVVYASIITLLGAGGPAGAASQTTSSATSYVSELFGYSVSWDSGWRLEQSSMRMNPRQDTLLLSNDDLGVGVVFSGMQGYAGNATTCLEDHEDAVRTVQYPDHDIVSLATGFAKPLRKASVTEAWVLYQVLDFSERSTERKNALVGITLCRTLEPDQSVIAIQTSLFWSEWETDLPPILDVMNSVEFPESAPEYRAFTVPTPNVILRDET